MSDHEPSSTTEPVPPSDVEPLLERELSLVSTPEMADAIVDRVEGAAQGLTEESAPAAFRGPEREMPSAPAPPSGAAEQLAREAAEAAVGGTGPRLADERAVEEEVAAVLATIASEAAEPAERAEMVLEAAQEVLHPSQRPPRPAGRGRRLLREAVLHRLGRMQALDARIYLAVNESPHPRAVDLLARTATHVTTGGWMWLAGVAVAQIRGVPGAGRALRVIAPCVLVSTFLVEHPLKELFRRRRPFIKIVEALVLGKKPGSWSFPSGHTAAAFSGAWVCTTIWPRRAPVFFGFATLVGASRVYVGAHYPGDVVSGATLGMLLSETIRRAIPRATSRSRRSGLRPLRLA